MSRLREFQAQLPEWRPDVEAWLETLPTTVRASPSRSSCLYLLNSPQLAAIGSETLRRLEPWWVDWVQLSDRAVMAGEVEQLLVRAAQALQHDDSGPALGLMLVVPSVHAFVWAHAAGTVYELVRERTTRHVFAP